jgi:hypothetical protein
MFAEMRSALGIPKSIDILDHIYSLPNTNGDPSDTTSASPQESAMAKIRAIESRAMLSQRPQPGLVQLMSYLHAKGVRRGICTRNFDEPVRHLIGKFLSGAEVGGSNETIQEERRGDKGEGTGGVLGRNGTGPFWPIITRAFRPPKPDPAGILYIAAEWAREDGWTLPSSAPLDSPPVAGEGEKAEVMRTSSSVGPPSFTTDEKQQTSLEKEIESSNAAAASVSVTSASVPTSTVEPVRGARIPIMMVGDSIDDMVAGYRAGAITVLLKNPANEHLAGEKYVHCVIKRLDELIGVLEGGQQFVWK